MAECPMTMGMLAPGSFVLDPRLIVGLLGLGDGLPTGDLVGVRRDGTAAFAFSNSAMPSTT